MGCEIRQEHRTPRAAAASVARDPYRQLKALGPVILVSYVDDREVARRSCTHVVHARSRAQAIYRNALRAHTKVRFEIQMADGQIFQRARPSLWRLVWTKPTGP